MGAHTFHLLIVERTNNSKTKTMNPSLLSSPPPWLPLKAKSSSQETSPQLLVCHSPTTASLTALPLALLPPQLSTLRPPLLPPSLPLSQLLVSSQLPPRPTLSHQQGSSTSQLSLSRSTRPLSNTDTRSSTKYSTQHFRIPLNKYHPFKDTQQQQQQQHAASSTSKEMRSTIIEMRVNIETHLRRKLFCSQAPSIMHSEAPEQFTEMSN